MSNFNPEASLVNVTSSNFGSNSLVNIGSGNNLENGKFQYLISIKIKILNSNLHIR